MKQILFPTAYTTHSEVAYRYAQKLAQYFEAGITLVHIYQSPRPSLASRNMLYNDLEKRSLQDFEEQQWTEQINRRT